MRQAKFTVALIPILLLALAFPGLTQAQTAKQGPMFGTWKLNLAKSDYGDNAKPQSMVVTVESDTPELVKFSVQMTGPTGMMFSYSYKGAADGKDYPAVGTASTYSYTEQDGVVTETEKDEDGTVTKGTFALSPNGKVGTWSYTVTDPQGNVSHEKLVYDKVNA